MAKRRRLSSAFKKSVALAALRGDRTLQEIAAENEVHPNQVRDWSVRPFTPYGEYVRISLTGSASVQSHIVGGLQVFQSLRSSIHYSHHIWKCALVHTPTA